MVQGRPRRRFSPRRLAETPTESEVPGAEINRQANRALFLDGFVVILQKRRGILQNFD
jgi:hypothetical protein